MCTTFYSQALDATETTTTIETMGEIEFRTETKGPRLMRKMGAKSTLCAKRRETSDGNIRRADNEIGQLRNGEKMDRRALHNRHIVSEGNVKKRKTRVQ